MVLVFGRSSSQAKTNIDLMHNNIPEDSPYPIRSVTDGTYHYIRNLTPDTIYIEKHLIRQNQWHQYWPTWIIDSTFSERTCLLVNCCMHRPHEQLYYLCDNPFEITNSAGQSKYVKVKQQLSDKHDSWLKNQGDLGAEIDTEKQ